MKVVILVPRRDDDGWRDNLWAFCKSIWETEYPEWPVFEGYHTIDEGPFNRSLAINRASEAAGDWDVALVIDSDTVSEPEAIRRAVQHAWETGDLSIGHNARYMLTQRGTQAFLQGASKDLVKRRSNIQVVYHDSISCAVAVRRAEWDLVGGFDDQFEGWGYEDTAFRIAVETLTNRPMHLETADCLHLWHKASAEADKNAPTLSKNKVRKQRYESAHWAPERIRAILDDKPDPGSLFGAIPKILHRTVPAETSKEVERWWEEFAVMHPTWDLRTHRDPLDLADFPIAGHLHEKCANGAQKAGLIRLELLVTHGGIYVDSDVQPVRPLEPLTWVPAFAGWEDERVVPDAVMGAVPNHPAFREMLSRAIQLIDGGSQDAWATGPGLSTAILPGRDDVLLLPPGSFYPVHYREKTALGTRNSKPWVFLEHKWHHSWKAVKVPRTQLQARVPAVVEPEIVLPADLKMILCMPWRDSGDQWRRDAHDWCLRWWDLAGFKVIEGEGQNRSEMCNNAAAKALAENANVLIIVDADTWALPSQVIKAAILTHNTNQLVHAFDSYTPIPPNVTRQGLKIDPTRSTPQRFLRSATGHRDHVSGLQAVSADLWNRLGGFDERFVGWGFEDQAFQLAAEVLGGETHRISGSAVHWYHREDPTKKIKASADDERVQLIASYCEAGGRIPARGVVSRLAAAHLISITGSEPNAGRMQEILSGPGGPFSPPIVIL